jgi:hypothetical protein
MPFFAFARKRQVMVITAVAASLAAPCTGAVDVTAPVGYLQSTYSGADCYYFTLIGHAPADPALGVTAWFAISRDQYGAKDAYAMLLSAKLAEKSVRVMTSGTTVCGGYPQATTILMP